METDSQKLTESRKPMTESVMSAQSAVLIIFFIRIDSWLSTKQKPRRKRPAGF
jgi:hypothetical protein